MYGIKNLTNTVGQDGIVIAFGRLFDSHSRQLHVIAEQRMDEVDFVFDRYCSALHESYNVWANSARYLNYGSQVNNRLSVRVTENVQLA